MFIDLSIVFSSLWLCVRCVLLLVKFIRDSLKSFGLVLLKSCWVSVFIRFRLLFCSSFEELWNMF